MRCGARSMQLWNPYRCELLPRINDTNLKPVTSERDTMRTAFRVATAQASRVGGGAWVAELKCLRYRALDWAQM